MPSPPELARAHYRRQAALARRAAAAVEALWVQLDPGDLSGSFRLLGPRMAGLVALAQYAAAAAAAQYVVDTLAAQDVTTPLLAEPDPRAFSGTAADGRDLLTLLEGGVIQAKALIGAGAPLREAFLSGQARSVLATTNEVQQAGRNADHVAMTSSAAQGYVRLVNPPCCSRCAILAGRFYRWSSGFDRHPHCFPAGTVVSGPAAEAATRRWYQGELVVLATASGQNLSLTGNHPVLTSRGWVPAHLLREGDEVVRSTRPEGATALVVPDHDEVPSLIEDVWRSFAVRGLDRMPSTAEDFHGDGQDGEVDVVYADGTLVGDFLAPLAQPASEFDFATGIGLAASLDGERAPGLLDLWSATHPRGSVRRDGLLLALGGGEVLVADKAGLAHGASFHPGLAQDARNRAAGDAVLPGQGVLTSTRRVGRDDLVGRQGLTARWDAPGDPFSVESREGYATRGLDLRDRLTGQVEPDRVVELRRVEWSGHVYSLTSSEGWHSANSLIVSNCDCVHVPASRAEEALGGMTPWGPDLSADPLELVRTGKVTGLSKAETDAVLNQGADLNQVVNAHRKGMYSFGTTREGATVRQGRAGRQIAKQVGLTDPGTITDGRVRRFTVRAIYEQAAGDRLKTIELLTRNGYMRESWTPEFRRSIRQAFRDLGVEWNAGTRYART